MAAICPEFKWSVLRLSGLPDFRSHSKSVVGDNKAQWVKQKMCYHILDHCVWYSYEGIIQFLKISRVILYKKTF